MALKLRQLGFTRIRPLEGGLDAWIEAGLPVDGDEPGSAPWTDAPPEDDGAAV